MRHSRERIEEKERNDWGGGERRDKLELGAFRSPAVFSPSLPTYISLSFFHLIHGNFKLLKPEISASLSPRAYPIEGSHCLYLQHVISIVSLGVAYLVQDTSLLLPGLLQ